MLPQDSTINRAITHDRFEVNAAIGQESNRKLAHKIVQLAKTIVLPSYRKKAWEASVTKSRQCLGQFESRKPGLRAAAKLIGFDAHSLGKGDEQIRQRRVVLIVMRQVCSMFVAAARHNDR